MVNASLREGRLPESFLADRTNGRDIDTVMRPSVVVCRLYGMFCG